MFPARYFPNRYYAVEYWAPVGELAAAQDIFNFTVYVDTLRILPIYIETVKTLSVDITSDVTLTMRI